MRRKIMIVAIFIAVQMSACSSANQSKKAEETVAKQNETEEVEQVQEELFPGYHSIPEQSFQIELEDWGTVDFVSGYYEEKMTTDLAFYLVKDEQVIYEFPKETLSKGVLDEVLAVGFCDINEDGKKDIVVIYTFKKEEQAQEDVSVPYARIYLSGNEEFQLADNLSDSIYENLGVESYTVDNVCQYISENGLLEAATNQEGIDQNRIRRTAYEAALTELLENHVLPDGTKADYDEMYEMSENKFAIFDIDQDGKEELLLSYTTGSMAGMTFGVYEYQEDVKEMRTELVEFPAISFYENGIVLAQASHNHGRSQLEDFWPYGIYEYDALNDQYECIANVDAWQKEYADADTFPDDVDADGDGVLYEIMDASFENQIDLLDGLDYQNWCSASFENASEIQINYKSLCSKEIESIQE